MDFTIRPAAAEDLQTVVALRMEVLREANALSPEANTQQLQAACEEYFRVALSAGDGLTLLAFDAEQAAGCGSICLYEVMPICDNPSGRCAVVMNLYTRPYWRRKGLAMGLLERLVAFSQAAGCGRIGLEATPVGKPLYRRFGFEVSTAEMVYTKQEGKREYAGNAANR